MTTGDTDAESDAIIAAGLSAVDRLREQIAAMEEAKASQPERLAKARSDAEEARGWALLEEPLDGQVKSIASIDGTASLSLPNILARELWGARLCFDLIDCGDDFDQIDAVITLFLLSAANGDTGIAMVIMSAALSTTASLIVPQLLMEIEHGGSNYAERVRLAEARAKAWNGRIAEPTQDDAADCGVKPVDGYDIGANALEPEQP